MADVIEPAAHQLATGRLTGDEREALERTLLAAAADLHALMNSASDPMRGWIDSPPADDALVSYAQLRAIPGSGDARGRLRTDDEITELGQVFARARQGMQSSAAFDRWTREFASTAPLHQIDVLGKGVAIGSLVEPALAANTTGAQRHFLAVSARDESRFERASRFALTDADRITDGDALLLVDDMVATGGTVVDAARMLRDRYPTSPIAVLTAATGWGLFADVDEGRVGASAQALSIFDLSTGERLLLDLPADW